MGARAQLSPCLIEKAKAGDGKPVLRTVQYSEVNEYYVI